MLIGVYKKNTAIVFANAIEIVTQTQRYFFSSFMFRDNAFKLLTQVWSDFVNASNGQSRVMLKSDGAELFNRNSSYHDYNLVEEESGAEESQMPQLSPPEEKLKDLKRLKKVKRNTSPKKMKTYSKDSTPPTESDGDDSVDSYASVEEPKKVKKKHKKKKSWPVSKKKSSLDLVPDIDVAQESLISADKLLMMNKSFQSSGQNLKNGETKKNRKGSKSSPSTDRKETKPEPLSEIISTPTPPLEREETVDEIIESEMVIPTSEGYVNPNEKSLSKILEKTLNITPSKLFELTFNNSKFLKDFADGCDYFPEWKFGDWTKDSANSCLTRTLNYKIPLNQSIGPKSTRVEGSQTVRMINSTDLIVDSQIISKDVPFGESFVVNEVWELTQEKSENGPQCHIVVKSGIMWKKSVWGLKGTIEKKSMEGSKTHSGIFISLAQDYLAASKDKASSSRSNGDGKKQREDENGDDDVDSKKSRKKLALRRRGKDRGDSFINSSQTELQQIDFPSSFPPAYVLGFVALLTLMLLVSVIYTIIISSKLSRLETLLTPETQFLIGSNTDLQAQNLLLQRLVEILMNNSTVP